MPTITATGGSQVDWLLTTACFQSRTQAQNNARANLKAAAARRCPNGYTIVSGPTFTTLVDCQLQWTGWWPEINTQVRASAVIRCDRSGQLPDFALFGGSDADELHDAVSAWRKHYNAVNALSDEIEAVTSAEAIVAFAETHGTERDLKVIRSAIDEGLAQIVRPPAREAFLQQGPYGEVLTQIAQQDGIEAVDAFLRDLEAAGRPVPDDARDVPCAQKVFNINIQF